MKINYKTIAGLLAFLVLASSTSAATFKVQVIPFGKPVGGHKILYTRYNTLPKSRYAGFLSMRTMEVNSDGSDLRAVGPQIHTQNQWLEGYGFYQGQPVTGLYSESAVNGAIDDTAHQVRPEVTSADIYIGTTNITAHAPGSYHSGAFIGSNGITFRSLYQGSTKSFLYDGKTIKQIGDQYGYGGQTSSLGILAYHHPSGQGYDLMIANRTVQTGQPWNFVCGWSPDGQYLLFLAGSDNRHADLFVCNKDGSNVHFLATRSGYFGASPLFDNGVDWHHGSSNLPCWINNSSVVYAANSGHSVELYRVNANTGDVTQLTSSPRGSWWANPQISSDGKIMVVTGCIKGKRDVYATDFRHIWNVTNDGVNGVWEPYIN